MLAKTLTQIYAYYFNKSITNLLRSENKQQPKQKNSRQYIEYICELV